MLDAGVNLQSGEVVVVGKKQKVDGEYDRRSRRKKRSCQRLRLIRIGKLPILNIKVEFLVGKLKTTFPSLNSTLFEIHMPWLKVGAICVKLKLVNIAKCVVLYNVLKEHYIMLRRLFMTRTLFRIALLNCGHS
ncbi:hypothetical protein Tco_1579747, partial [Tanacetum coccineum]